MHVLGQGAKWNKATIYGVMTESQPRQNEKAVPRGLGWPVVAGLLPQLRGPPPSYFSRMQAALLLPSPTWHGLAGYCKSGLGSGGESPWSLESGLA